MTTAAPHNQRTASISDDDGNNKTSESLSDIGFDKTDEHDTIEYVTAELEETSHNQETNSSTHRC